MIDLLEIKNRRYVISLLVALALSLVANYYLGETTFFLIPLTTLFVMQTSIGNSFYQGMQKLILLLLIIAVISLMIYSHAFFYSMSRDVCVGAAIGIIARLVILPEKPATEFREEIFPVIKTLNTYFSTIIDQLLQHDIKASNNIALEQSLLQLPDWVYQPGFNSALKTGYRFFLSNVEKIADILMSMHHLSRYEYEKELVAKIRPVLLQYVDNVNIFFNSVITVLELKKLSEEPSDLSHEMAELQKQLFTIVPANLELLDMRRDYVYLAEFIYNLKDLRKLLLKMGEALR
jgi:hypothetical protein